MGGGEKLLEQIFNLRFAAKQLNKSAAKAEREHKAEKDKCLAAMKKGHDDIAKLHAESAIRKHNEQLNCLRLASRLDAVVSKLDTQAKMQGVSRTMAGIVETMNKALAANQLDRVYETMRQFEKANESLDVQAGVISDAMGTQAAMSTPADAVDTFMQQLRDEANLQVGAALPSAAAMGAGPSGARVAAPPSDAGTEDLSRRLAELRGR